MKENLLPVLFQSNYLNHKNYNFLPCDWFKKALFSTNSLAKLLSNSLLLDSLLLDSLLSDSSISQSHSKMYLQFKSTNHIQNCNYGLRTGALAFVFLWVTLECIRLLCQYFNANFPLFSYLGYFFFFSEIVIFMVN